MSKVYLNPQKIFKYLGVLIVSFGVTSCVPSQTLTSSGETDGVYYSPSKDGQLESYSSESAQNYDIKVGSPYFDANDNGAEEFYYDSEEGYNQEQASTNINIYNNGLGSNLYSYSSSTDWGRYDGVDITINNYGWAGLGYSSWGWGWGWGYPSYYGWYYPRWRGYHYPYWGGYYGYPYYGYPYYNWGGYYGYYGYYNNWNNYYYRGGTRVQPGLRSGNSFALQGSPHRMTTPRRGTAISSSVKPTRNANSSSVRSTNNFRATDASTRPVRNVRTNENVRTEGTPRNVRTNTPNTRNTNPSGNNRATNTPNVNTRPVRTTAPPNVRPNSPTRNNSNINSNPRTNTNSPNYNPSPRSQQSTPSYTPSSPRNSGSGSINSGNRGTSRSGGGGAVRSSGGRR